MQAFSRSDKERILDILCKAFDKNKSVNYIAGGDSGRERRIRALMAYSFEVCRRFGAVYFSDDRQACALVLHPHRKRFSIAGIALDLKLVVRCIGLRRLSRTLRREATIKRHHPSGPFTYLWFIAVDPQSQGKGHGAALLQRIQADSAAAGYPVYLETSTEANLPWYERRGLSVFHREAFGYTVYFLRTEI